MFSFVEATKAGASNVFYCAALLLVWFDPLPSPMVALVTLAEFYCGWMRLHYDSLLINSLLFCYGSVESSRFVSSDSHHVVFYFHWFFTER